MKKEYSLVETIDYADKVKVTRWFKRDADHALKAKKDAYEHRGKLLTIYTDEDSAYYRTLGTSYHIEIREVSDWRLAE